MFVQGLEKNFPIIRWGEICDTIQKPQDISAGRKTLDKSDYVASTPNHLKLL